jgi:hypothetical protein
MDVLAGSGNDEYFTPRYAVEPILKYISPGSTVWCPFDVDGRSNFVSMLRERGCTVIPSHVSDGRDFFEYEPEEYDVTVSNPPYSRKGDVLERLFELGRPFAMLVGVAGLFETRRRFEMFAGNRFEIMYLSRRVGYQREYGDETSRTSPPFSSVYVTSGLLPDRIVFERVDAGSGG